MASVSINEIDIWSGIICPDENDMLVSDARAILHWAFNDQAKMRMEELATRNGQGKLTEPEQEELQAYVHVGQVIGILQAKARLSLKRAGDNNDCWCMPMPQRQQVWERANGRCEYCQMPQEHDPRPFHLDHIRPQKHDGPTVLGNLSLSCAACSLFKGPNPAGYDPETDEICQLFNPRSQNWKEHFQWDGAELKGLTPVG